LDPQFCKRIEPNGRIEKIEGKRMKELQRLGKPFWKNGPEFVIEFSLPDEL